PGDDTKRLRIACGPKSSHSRTPSRVQSRQVSITPSRAVLVFEWLALNRGPVFVHPRHDLGQPPVERDLRLPAEFGAGLGRIDDVGRVLTRPLIDGARRGVEANAEAVAQESHDFANLDAAVGREVVSVPDTAAL